MKSYIVITLLGLSIAACSETRHAIGKRACDISDTQLRIRAFEQMEKALEGSNKGVTVIIDKDVYCGD